MIAQQVLLITEPTLQPEICTFESTFNFFFLNHQSFMVVVAAAVVVVVFGIQIALDFRKADLCP